MKRLSFFIFSVLIFSLIQLPVLAYQQAVDTPIMANELVSKNTWEIWKKNSGQSVKYRPVVINGKELIEINASAKVSSSLSGFLYFLLDVSNTPNWLVNAHDSQLITPSSGFENSFYITLTNLWPLQPRVLILHSSYWQNDDLSIEIVIEDLEPEIAVNNQLRDKIDVDKYLRVKTHSAQWKITPEKPVENKQAELFIEYTYIADGIGDTPKWLADHFALKSMWKSIQNLRRHLPQEKWQTKKIKGITERTVMPLEILDKKHHD